MESWVFSLNANRTVVVHSQKWCLSLYRIREWFGKVTDKFVGRKIFQKFSVYLYFLFRQYAFTYASRTPAHRFLELFLSSFPVVRNRLIYNGVGRTLCRVPACAGRISLGRRRKAEREKRV